MYASKNGLTTLAIIPAYYTLNTLRELCAISRNGTIINDLYSATVYFSLNSRILDIEAD